MLPDFSKESPRIQSARRRDDDDEYDYDDIRVIKRRKPRDNNKLLRIIGALAGVGVVVALCCIGGIAAYWVANTPPFLGEWESTTMKRPVRAQGPGMDEQIPEVLLLLEKAPDGQLGTYTDENDQEFFFRWQDHDKNQKTVVFVMENPNDTFWRGIRSPATFTYSVAGNRMTLTGGGHTVTFKKFLD
jgi:hypothetical protein